MQAAVQALIGYLDEGRKPSARRAAVRPGLNEQQSNKLAYSVPVKRELVRAAVDVRSDSLFVQQMRGDAGMTDLVVDDHVKLSKLAGVLSNAHRSLAQRVQDLEVAVIFLAGEVQNCRDGGNSRGHWHPRALELRKQGMGTYENGSMQNAPRMQGYEFTAEQHQQFQAAVDRITSTLGVTMLPVFGSASGFAGVTVALVDDTLRAHGTLLHLQSARDKGGMLWFGVMDSQSHRARTQRRQACRSAFQDIARAT